ncbi:hypothetical protein [Fervidibacillus halotolerans]|uniref:Uncharacterized protein n=1 Tax=Fervidibacillus halotolerans TaxID=2980027 RepID=A0A9E8M1Q9_9BACI|nr:hypothetical protein [Fervidibacillus halotolerans]WAA12836.1 hypothetical protein OE105_01440 [Fervidibacillus halotolerans]
MQKKWLFFFIISYLVAFSINVFPSMKFPDVSVNGYHILATCFFLVGLVTYILKGMKSSIEISRLKGFLFIGFFSGFLIYLFHIFEDIGAGGFAADIIGSIQYPFYIIFTIPLFGGNYLFQLNYAIYSIIASFIYFILYLWVNRRAKQ